MRGNCISMWRSLEEAFAHFTIVVKIGSRKPVVVVKAEFTAALWAPAATRSII